MAASAGHAVIYTIGPIFKHIIDCGQPYFTTTFTNFVLKASIVSGLPKQYLSLMAAHK